jgi:hypothetical protein
MTRDMRRIMLAALLAGSASLGGTAALAQDNSDHPTSTQDKKAEPAKPDATKPPQAKAPEAKPDEKAPNSAQAMRPGDAPREGPAKPASAGPAGHQPGRDQATPAASHPGNDSKRPDYHVDRKVTTTVRQHFSTEIAHVDRSHRVSFSIGVVVPQTYVASIEPVPAELLVGVAPPPAGYVTGYYDGYMLVYDPQSYVVIDVVDLL